MNDLRLADFSLDNPVQILRLQWKCVELHPNGAPRAYRSARAYHYIISLGATRWIIVTRYGRYEIPEDGRIRLFHNAAAAAGWIEDHKEAFDPLAI
ncbi:hypothetical protein RZS28_19905 (plasmid) [Methylocapsa polymorpha]|uniref:Uncharacterized protein n=1 Tax=Methylocapsa polymorpha TaxID=3080828 RepID=A0ABZ0HZE0_9HYPH|nr:hypothetical protein [Methylocapsa sp. RX1]WOJ91710.1 hypothetical protein RZS28_19905 [Methylocapsa sp. RX1]